MYVQTTMRVLALGNASTGGTISPVKTVSGTSVSTYRPVHDACMYNPVMMVRVVVSVPVTRLVVLVCLRTDHKTVTTVNARSVSMYRPHDACMYTLVMLVLAGIVPPCPVDTGIT